MGNCTSRTELDNCDPINAAYVNVVQSRNNDAVALLGAGLPRDALRACRLALELYRILLDGRPDDDISARILHVIAVAHTALAEHDAALAAAQEAGQIHRRVCGGVDDERLAQSLHYLGAAFERLGRYDDALVQFTEALGIRRRLASGADNEYVARSMNAVGGALSHLNRDEEALPHLRDALAMLRRLPGERDSTEIAFVMTNLAATFGRLDRDPKEMRSLNELSRKVDRRLARDKDVGRLAMALGNMGTSKYRQRDFASALQLYTESYEMLMRLFPKGHRATAVTLCNIGCALLKKKETRDEGVQKIGEGLAMHRRLARDRSEFAACLRICGAALSNIGRVEKGEQLIKEGDEMKARIAAVATAAAADSTTTPAQQVDTRSSSPQPTTASDSAVGGGASMPRRSAAAASSTDS